MKLKNFLFLSLFFLCSCSLTEKEGIPIGIDPNFYPVNFGRKQGDVNAYIRQLLQMISEEEAISFNLIDVNWDTIYDQLDSEELVGIITPISPDTFVRNQYSFSDPILKTGPVLVVGIDNKASSLEDLQGRTVVIVPGYFGMNELQMHPQVIVRSATSFAGALNDVQDKRANGAILPYITARNYVDDLYHDTLRIATEPMTERAIFLVTLKDKNKDFLYRFNKGYEKLLKAGKIDDLRKRWGF